MIISTPSHSYNDWVKRLWTYTQEAKKSWKQTGDNMAVINRYRQHGEHIQCAECFGFDKHHNVGCGAVRPFPIQGGGTIPWWLAEEAYEHYAQQFGTKQDLQHLACRGGFGPGELLELLRKTL